VRRLFTAALLDPVLAIDPSGPWIGSGFCGLVDFGGR
jgi:hypothetical protein